MTDHPITPPLELVQQWIARPACQDYFSTIEEVAIAAARWGADQELEACCEWLDIPNNRSDRGDGWLMPGRLRAARRPKPTGLAERSLALIDKIQSNKKMWQIEELDVVRRALERLQELENNG